MSRRNSLSDSEIRSLTSDFEEGNDFELESAPPVTSHRSPRSSPVQSLSLSEIAPQAQQAKTESEIPSTVQPQQPPFTEVYSAPSNVPARKATTLSTNDKPVRSSVPLERFRTSVRKVIHLTRGSSMMSLGGAGAEPGIDPRRSSANLDYGHVREKCSIDIVDYSSLRFSHKSMHNQEFVEFMDKAALTTRDPWVKVRWINIGGLSWDVMSAVALTYSESTSQTLFWSYMLNFRLIQTCTLSR